MSKNKLNFYPVFYAILMTIFFLLAYLFIVVGIDTKTKISVAYQEKSTTTYRATLLPNDIYNSSIYQPKQSYISSVIDDIIVSFNYQNSFSEIVSGYYQYNITSELLIYDQTINNPLIRKATIINEDKYIVLDQGNVTNFSLNDYFVIDFDNYLRTYQSITEKYRLNVLGNLIIKINFSEFLGFASLKNDQEHQNAIIINIPISDTTFKVNITDLNNLNHFSEYSQHEDVNYLALILGITFLSFALSFLTLVLYTLKTIYNKQLIYTKTIKDILNQYDRVIIKTNKFYNFKNYNLIYVTSFKELLEVHQATKNLIIYKKIKKYQQAVFVIIDRDNAWIYQLKKK